MKLEHNYSELDLDCCCLNCENSTLTLKNKEIWANCPNQIGERRGDKGVCDKHE